MQSSVGVQHNLGFTTDKFNDEHTEFLKEYFINKNKEASSFMFLNI